MAGNRQCYVFNIVLAANASAGKTSLVRRFVDDYFDGSLDRAFGMPLST